MKNIKRIAAFLIAAVIACVCLVSCSGKDDFVGKWELEEMDTYRRWPIGATWQ